MSSDLEPPRRTSREQLARNLSIISAAIGKDLQLSSSGICAFSYEGLTIVIESPENIESFFVYCDVFSLADVPESNILDVKVQFVKMKDRVLEYPIHRGMMPKNVEDNNLLNISIRVEGQELKAEKFRDILETFIDCSLNIRKQLRVVSMGRIIYNP